MYLRYFAVLATAIAVFLVGVVKPAYNFDIIGYVATAHYNQGLRGAALAERSYADVQAEIGEARFDTLLSGRYGEIVRHDPAALEQQLPFYTIRMGYVWAMEAAHRLGLDYARATYVLSAFFQALAVLLLAGIAGRVGVSLWAVPGVAFLANFGELAQLSTPDAMTCCVSLAAIYCAARRSAWAYLFAAALPLVRTDFLLFALPLFLFLFVHDRRRLALVGALTALALYIGNNALNGNYGYRVIFHFTLIGLDPYPATMAVSSDPADYLHAYLRMFATFAKSPHAAIYFVSAAAALLHWRRLGRAPLLPVGPGGGPLTGAAEFQLLFLVPAAFFVAHLLLFPIYMERYFAAVAALMLVWVIGLIGRLRPA